MKRIKSFFQLALLYFIASTTLFSCMGPYKTPLYYNIGTNETAFLIPMEKGSQSGQQMFKSVEYLEKNKVAAKRVYVEQTRIETGRYSGDYKWIPTDTVVIVHRAPVTREWTNAGSGTSKQNEILNVESKESIGFDVPVNCTGSVLEEDAAKFLYHFGGQNIEYVMDHNVRPYILDILTSEFGKLPLDDCQNKRTMVYDTMKVKTQRFFKEFGLTIVNLGVAGQFVYTDKDIQTAINTKFISEMKIIAAQNEASAAKKFAEAAEAIRKQKELDANVAFIANLGEAAKKGLLPCPQTVVFGTSGGSLLDLWAVKNLNATNTSSTNSSSSSKTTKTK